MAIETFEGGGFSVTGAASIRVLRLLSLRSALTLEMKGLRLSRGVSALALAKIETKLSSNDRAKQIEALGAVIDAAAALAAAQS